MIVQPILALISPEIIGIVVVLGVLLFGAENLPKLARSAGQAKKEFMLAQVEAARAQAGQADAPAQSAEKDAVSG